MEGGERSSVRLGADLAAGERPQAVVPAGVWQMARPLGGWTLTGCTVAPAFEFAGFDWRRRVGSRGTKTAWRRVPALRWRRYSCSRR